MSVELTHDLLVHLRDDSSSQERDYHFTGLCEHLLRIRAEVARLIAANEHWHIRVDQLITDVTEARAALASARGAALEAANLVVEEARLLTIEECAKVAEQYEEAGTNTAAIIAAEIRALAARTAG